MSDEKELLNGHTKDEWFSYYNYTLQNATTVRYVINDAEMEAYIEWLTNGTPRPDIPGFSEAGCFTIIQKGEGSTRLWHKLCPYSVTVNTLDTGNVWVITAGAPNAEDAAISTLHYLSRLRNGDISTTLLCFPEPALGMWFNTTMPILRVYDEEEEEYDTVTYYAIRYGSEPNIDRDDRLGLFYAPTPESIAIYGELAFEELYTVVNPCYLCDPAQAAFLRRQRDEGQERKRQRLQACAKH